MQLNKQIVYLHENIMAEIFNQFHIYFFVLWSNHSLIYGLFTSLLLERHRSKYEDLVLEQYSSMKTKLNEDKVNL